MTTSTNKKIYITFILFMIFAFVLTSVAYADYGRVHIKEGSINGGASNILYWFDISVATYGYTGSFNNAFDEWEQASSNIGFTEAPSAETSELKIYVGRGNLPPGTYGSADYWEYGFFGGISQVSSSDVTNGENYDQGRIRIDDETCDNADFNYTHTYKLAGHEVGHILGLNHFEDAPSHSGNHWMKSGKISLTSPTSTDIDHVTEKWGN